jgi:hypothetical protein
LLLFILNINVWSVEINLSYVVIMDLKF